LVLRVKKLVRENDSFYLEKSGKGQGNEFCKVVGTMRRQVSNAAKKVRQVSRCSAVQSLVYKNCQFEIDALRSTKPVKTDKSVSDVI